MGVDYEAVAEELERDRTQHGISGLAAGVVTRDGEHCWLLGATGPATSAPVTAETMFSMQSISKLYTAMLVLSLEATGALSLDATIRNLLPGFTVRSRFDGHPEDQITLRHLLSHTAGLTHEAPYGNNYADFDAPFDMHVESISKTWLRYPVGSHFAYSNLGFDLAARIVEVVTSSTLDEAFQEHVAEPLGLDRTTYDPDRATADPDRAHGQDPGVGEDNPDRLPILGAGGVFSTPTDVMRVLRAVVGHFDDGGILPEGLFDRMTEVPFPRPGQQSGYGLGLAEVINAGTVLRGHSGGGMGFLTDLYWTTDRTVGVFMLSNRNDHPLLVGLAVRLLHHVAGKPTLQAEPISEKPARPVAFGRFAGTYIGRFFSVTLEERDGIFGAFAFGAFLPAYSPGQDLLEVQAGQRVLRVRVETSDSGQPAGFTLLSDGSWFDYVAEASTAEADELDAAAGRYVIRLGTTDLWQTTVAADPPSITDPRQDVQLSLTRQAPGIWFSSTGEALEIDNHGLRYGSIPLHRIS